MKEDENAKKSMDILNQALFLAKSADIPIVNFATTLFYFTSQIIGKSALSLEALDKIILQIKEGSIIEFNKRS